MYDAFLTLALFVTLFFVYLHITDQYKTSEDLEIYEMDFIDVDTLQEVCNVRQPVLFEFRNTYPRIFEEVNTDTIFTKNEKTPLISVKDVNDYWKTDTVDIVPLGFGNFRMLAITDSKSHYYSDNNYTFVEETFIKKEAQNLDDFFKPDYIVSTTYDILMGSSGCPMPLQYHNHYRRFFVVLSGNIRVKMTPWKNRKHLHTVYDYEKYEFRSKINVWSPQQKYRNDMEQTKFLEFDVKEGHVLYVPPYWWYSFEFPDANPLLLSVTYDSAMSRLSNSWDLTKYFFQQQNIKEKVTRTFVPEPKVEEEPQLDLIEEYEEEQEEEIEKERENPEYSVKYPSGEPYTENTSHLLGQIQMREMVDIREQNSQIIEHMMG
jgi:mannose-6-phosphate isomerase-like protein (cupin superfamily)